MASLERAVMRNLECPICFSLLTQPKQLSCTHTFCEACLTGLLSAQTATGSIHCPVCRRSTDIGNEGVSSLPTNFPLKAIVSDVKASGYSCNNCDNGLEAEYYCSDCEHYLCSDCHEIHGKLRRNSNHDVVRTDDVKQGKVVPRRKVLCQEHEPGEGDHECSDVCITCKKFICLRCRMLEHVTHEVVSALKYQDSYSRNAESLRVKAKTKKTNVMKHAELIEAEKRKVVKHIDSLTTKIDRTYNEIINRLKEDKLFLDMKCRTEKERLCRELDEMKIQDEQLVDRIDSADSLVTKNCQAPLRVNTVPVRESLCDQLKQVLGEDDPSSASVQEITCRAGKLEYEQNTELIKIGKVQYSEWGVKADVTLSTADIMGCMAATPDGRIAVGRQSGIMGIEIYSADGQLQERVLNGVPVHGIAFLNGGRCAVRDLGGPVRNNLNVSLYTQVWKKVDVRFDTLSLDVGGGGDLTVDCDDHIYVGYWKAKKIQVFTPAGGKPVREIACDGYIPHQIFTMKMSKMIVVMDSGNSTRVINELGGKQHEVIQSTDVSAFPAVCKDGTILVATVNKARGRVSIEHYTAEMKHVATLITDHVIQISVINWCYLREFTSGEIALRTNGRLYIFRKSVTPTDV